MIEAVVVKHKVVVSRGPTRIPSANILSEYLLSIVCLITCPPEKKLRSDEQIRLDFTAELLKQLTERCPWDYEGTEENPTITISTLPAGLVIHNGLPIAYLATELINACYAIHKDCFMHCLRKPKRKFFRKEPSPIALEVEAFAMALTDKLFRKRLSSYTLT